MRVSFDVGDIIYVGETDDIVTVVSVGWRYLFSDGTWEHPRVVHEHYKHGFIIILEDTNEVY